MPHVSLGPIIGKVTARTARVVLEFSDDGTYSLTARSASGHTVTATARAVGTSPQVFTFDGLRPDTRYALDAEVQWPIDVAERGFRTLPAAPTSLTVALVSCNNVEERGSTDLWHDLWRNHVRTGEIDLIIHGGDQVYADDEEHDHYAKAIGVLRGGGARGAARRAVLAQTREVFRALYRSTWRHVAMRKCLANTANLMIWDDHEIRDDWGARDSDNRPGTNAHTVGLIARGVYRAYQRQLWDDVEVGDPQVIVPEGIVGDEHHFHAFGQIGVAFLDLRSGRSFEKVSGKPFVGRQIEQLQDAIERGALRDVRALLLVSPVPVAYLSSSMTDQLASVPVDTLDDLRDHWTFAPHRAELAALLEVLRRWQNRPGRSVLILSGDVHVGGLTSIRHTDRTIINQVISSPMTNAPPGRAGFKVVKALLANDSGRITPDWTCAHTRLTNKRNYAIVKVTVPPRASPKYRIKQMRA